MKREALTDADDLALDIPDKPLLIPSVEREREHRMGKELYAQYRQEQEAHWGKMEMEEE